MLLRKEVQTGDLFITVYDFENQGDVLEKHSHSAETVHITIVARGSVRVYSHDWETVATTGQILDFRPNEPHTFESLEAQTRIVNIPKNVRAFLGAPVEAEQ